MLSIIFSCAIFLLTFIVIFSEKIHREVIALYGAIIMVTFWLLFDFYHFSDLLQVIDFNTLLLLFGMMVMVTVLEHTGFFQYIALWSAKKTHGDPWRLTVFLATITTLLSMVLDNVTTLLLIVPVTLIITRLFKISPAPILIAEAVLSNIGWVATLVWDPPNIIIGSAANFSFNDFLTHSFPVVIVAWFFVLMYIRYVFRSEFVSKKKNEKLAHKIKTHKTIPHKKTLIKTLMVLWLVVIFFFLHGLLHIPASFVAIFGAALLLLVVSPHKNPKYILQKMDTDILIFFASLFVLVGGLEYAWVLDYFVGLMLAGASQNIVLTALLVLWGSAILSAILDNIPMTVAMIPIIWALQAQWMVWVDLLWWALVFGVGFGGNATPIWSTAWMIVMNKSESTRDPITTKWWMKVGVPASIIGLLCASYALVICGHYFY